MLKNHFIATTALVATAGVASAESFMNISGYARFGMVWNEGTAAVPAVRGTHTAAEINSFVAANARFIGLIDGTTPAATAAARIEAVQTAVTTAFSAAAAPAGETAAARGARIAAAIDTALDAQVPGLALGAGASALVAAAAGAGTTAATFAALVDARDTAVEDLAALQAAAAAAGTTVPAADLAAANREIAALEALVAASQGEAAVAAVEDAMTTASRLRIQFDMGTTTDGGIGLNVRQRFQAEENGAGTGGNGARFGLTYGGFAVNVGNIIGVVEATPNLYMNTNSAGVGLEGNGFHSLAVSNYTAYSSGGAGATDGVEVIYSANGLRLHAHDTDGSSAFGGSFAMGDVTVAAAYEDFDDGANTTLLTAGMNIGAGWVAVAHGIDDDGAGTETDKTVLKGGYDIMPGANVYGFVANGDAGDAAGIGMSYDLGGGASFDAGYTNTAADLGILSAGIFFTF